MVMGLATSALVAQAAIEIDFSGLSAIQFKNSTFQIAGNGSTIVTSSTGDNANLDFGSLSTGPFSIGFISTSQGNQSATVFTAPGTMISFNDGVGGTLSGYLNWGTITTYGNSGVGGISDGLMVNVYGLTYSGSAQTLLTQFANAGVATLNLSFQFPKPYTLTDLANSQTWVGTSYSGSLTAVPEPTTFVAGLGALGMLGLFGWRSRQ